MRFAAVFVAIILPAIFAAHVAAQPSMLPAHRIEDVLPQSAWDLLENADEYEVLTGERDGFDVGKGAIPAPSVDHLPGFKIKSRVIVTDPATRQRLSRALREDVQQSNDSVAGCFDPHHAIHVVRGDHAYDFIVCFGCGGVMGIGEDGRSVFVRTSQSSKPVFTDVLKSAQPVEQQSTIRARRMKIGAGVAMPLVAGALAYGQHRRRRRAIEVSQQSVPD